MHAVGFSIFNVYNENILEKLVNRFSSPSPLDFNIIWDTQEFLTFTPHCDSDKEAHALINTNVTNRPRIFEYLAHLLALWP